MTSSRLQGAVEANFHSHSMDNNKTNQTAANEKIMWRVSVILEHGYHSVPARIRHAGLYFDSGDDNDVYYFDAVFNGSNFFLQWMQEFNPIRQGAVAAHVDVGSLAYGIGGHDLVDVLGGVAIPTQAKDPEYSCQQWVRDALTKLYMRAFLTYSQYSKGYTGLQADGTVMAT